MVYVDVISGFLGAGKTTFSNQLLGYYLSLGLRPVYVVNEFGETGLDSEITRANGFSSIAMPNGCVCCTLRHDVPAVLTEVIRTFQPTHLVFEMSGIFIFEQFLDTLAAPPLSSLCRLSHAFTVVDSVNFKRAKIPFGSFIYNQIRHAPVIILSKTDIAKDDIDEIICDIRMINARGHIVPVPCKERDARLLESLLALPQDTAPSILDEQGERGHHLHFSAKTICPVKMTQAQYQTLVARLQSGELGDIIRAKGILWVADKPHLFNFTMQHVSCVPYDPAEKPALTFIGRHLNEEKIQAYHEKQR